MKSKGLKKAAIMIAAVLMAVQCAMPVSAYFDRGTVSISTGKSNVTLTAGSSETVSVSMSPASSTQLPGCGMAECPQTCGEKECLDANGECTCNGKTPQTYYAYASASSSNTSVATASCDNGTVTIKGVSEGTATITLTASLRQYSSSSTSIQVTVQNNKNEIEDEGENSNNSDSSNNSNSNNNNNNNGGGNSNSTSGNTGGSTSTGGNKADNSSTGQTSGSSTGSVSVTKVNGDVETSKKEEQTAEEKEENQDEENGLPEGVTSIESDRGIIYFVPITAGKMGSEWLSKIQGKEEYVDFQMKDDADTVLYAWEFYGKDIKNVADMDYTIESSSTVFDGCSYGTSADSLYLSFAHKGELSGKASVFLRADTSFTDKDVLNLYSYDADTDTVTLVQKEIACVNGYVTMELEECSQYILTTQTLENVIEEETEEIEEPEEKEVEDAEEPEPVEEVGQKAPVKVIVTVIVIIIAAAAVAGAVCYRKKKNGSIEDISTEDAGAEDVSAEDAGAEDVSTEDAGAEDVSTEDAGAEDVSAEDAGAEDVNKEDESV